MEIFLSIGAFILVPITVVYFAKKTTKKFTYNWKSILKLTIFGYLWSFANIFIHEVGHGLIANFFGYSVNKINVGMGPKLFNFGGGKYTETVFRIFPVHGYTSHELVKNTSKEIIILAMGVIAQFLFLYLVYWLLKRNEKWRESVIGHFCYHYAIKIAFWLTFVLNFPFFLSRSDWTKIAKILLGWK